MSKKPAPKKTTSEVTAPAASLTALPMIPVKDIVFNDDILVRSVNKKDERYAALVDSIRQHGVLQPVVLHKTEDGKMELVIGSHRCAAAKEAGIKEIPFTLTDAKTRAELISKGLDENEARIPLTVLQQANVLGRARDLTDNANNVRLAKILGRSPRWIAGHLGVLELPPEIQAMFDNPDGSVTIEKAHDFLRIAPEFRANFVQPLKVYTGPAFRKYVEQQVEKGEAKFISGKAATRAKKGTKAEKSEKADKAHTVTAKDEDGGDVELDMLSALKVEKLARKAEENAQAEEAKPEAKRDLALIAFNRGRLSAFLQVLRLDPKSPTVDAAVAKAGGDED